VLSSGENFSFSSSISARREWLCFSRFASLLCMSERLLDVFLR
jgi:hypothetical protein